MRLCCWQVFDHGSEQEAGSAAGVGPQSLQPAARRPVGSQTFSNPQKRTMKSRLLTFPSFFHQLAERRHTRLQPSGLGLEPQIHVRLRPAGQVRLLILVLVVEGETKKSTHKRILIRFYYNSEPNGRTINQ